MVFVMLFGLKAISLSKVPKPHTASVKPSHEEFLTTYRAREGGIVIRPVGFRVCLSEGLLRPG